MRINVFAPFKKSSNPKVLTKPVKHPRLRYILISEAVMALIFLMATVPGIVRGYQQEKEARAFIEAIATGYKVAQAEDVRVAAESEIMLQFTHLRNTLYCEAPRLQGNKLSDVKDEMYALADAVFSRVDSPNYPDTIKDVVTEVRIDRISGKKVAMFSPYFTPCFYGAKETTKWKVAGLMAAIALKDRWDGKPSSGNTHFVMDYVNPKWKTQDVANCILEPKGKIAGFHAFFEEVKPEDRPACRKERKLAAAEALKELAQTEAKATNTVVLPEGKDIPVPAQRPTYDEVASLINNS